MRDGFIKVAAATPEIRTADPAYNEKQIERQIVRAADEKAALLVLPELVLTGYTCGDLFLQETLLNGAEAALGTLMEFSRSFSMVLCLGLPVLYGNRLYNCAAVIQSGRLLGVVPKSCIPSYSEFYEGRHFSAAPEANGRVRLAGETVPFGPRLLFACETVPDWVFGVEICEDLWTPLPVSGFHAVAGATMIVNCSASDELTGKAAYRRQLVAQQSARLCAGYIYCDAGDGESTTDLVFAGHNLIAENGTILAESPLFQNGMTVSEIDVKRMAFEKRRMNTYPKAREDGYEIVPFAAEPAATELTRFIDPHPFVPSSDEARRQRCENILLMQTNGLKKRVSHTNCKALMVGISGGLDSCLALLIAARAMDQLGRSRGQVHAITMPCFGTTARTRGNAERLSERLGVTLECIEITEAVKRHFEDIGQDPSCHDAAYENAQARERTKVLMDRANQEGGLVVGTGDLSELALGWTTYNGDHMSMYGVNASIPKTLVRHLVRFEADRAEDPELKAVLLDILATPVSPELLPARDGEIAQKTEDIVGPYELHDFFLYYVVRWAMPPKKIFRLAVRAFCGVYEPAVILKWMKIFYQRFFSQQFKRSCLPDGPRVGSVAVSPRGDLRMPSDASFRLWMDQLEQIDPDGLHN